MTKSFKNYFCLTETEISHKTYHHFVGGGQFDSNVDVILYSKSKSPCYAEKITDILCKNEIPAMNSHHDAILSMLTLPISLQQESSSADLLVAPKLDHQRTRITWSDQGIQDYSTVASGHLRRIRNTWMDPSSQASMSVLLQLTNSIHHGKCCLSDK